MARAQKKLHEILPAIIDRLRDQIDWANESNCFFSLNSRAKPNHDPGGIWLTVSPGGGKFDEQAFAGAGREAMITDTNFTVTAHSPVALDERGHDLEFLVHESLGVIRAMDDVLEALAGHDLSDGTDELTREPIYPNGWEEPERQTEWLGRLGMVFALKFDWRLA